jgi:glycosyltransferase involved in cell wall biosynthesis
MKTSLPTALVYGWDRFGEIKLQSDVYWEERLFEDVVIYSYESDSNFNINFSKHRPDIVIIFGDSKPNGIDELINHTMVNSKVHYYDNILPDNILANVIVCESSFWNTNVEKQIYKSDNPIFSIFTPTYMTNERIFRTYESLKNQTYVDWEWVVVDDSPDGDYKTFEYLKDLERQDYRVKVYRISPNSGGNVGEVKHRAAMLCNGKWLVELDHDDYLMPTALEDILSASKEYPDAGFIYTDCCELYEDGSMRQYGLVGERDYWYANEENGFAFRYSGHKWETHYGKEYLVHKYTDINPKTIRFNISMPNHTRVWRADIYHKIGGHNRNISVADDFELIVKTFLETRFIHLKKMLYLQYNNYNSTVDNNATDINRRARLIRDGYDLRIHNRIIELGVEDWVWDFENNRSHQLQAWMDTTRYFDREGVLNYIVE